LHTPLRVVATRLLFGLAGKLAELRGGTLERAQGATGIATVRELRGELGLGAVEVIAKLQEGHGL
jgi:hypothetical protein